MSSHVIRNYREVKGIRVVDTEIKYADDSTYYLDKYKNCPIVYNGCHGHNVITIRVSRDRRKAWEGTFGLDWTHSFDILGIHYNVNKFK